MDGIRTVFPLAVFVALLPSLRAVPVQFVSETREINVSGTGYSQTYAPGSAFGDFSRSVTGSGADRSAYSGAGQLSTFSSDQISAQSYAWASARFNSDEFPMPAAEASTRFEATFKVLETVMFDLAATRAFDGLGVFWPVFQLTASTGETQLSWTSLVTAANATYEETNFGLGLIASGILLPGTYTLTLQEGVSVSASVWNLNGYGSNSYEMTLKFIEVPDGGATWILLLTGVGFLAGLRRRIR